MRVDPGFADERDRFSQTLDGRGDEEIAAEFDEIGVGGIFADNERLLPDGIKQRLADFGERLTPPPSKVGSAAVPGFPLGQGAGFTVPE